MGRRQMHLQSYNTQEEGETYTQAQTIRTFKEHEREWEENTIHRIHDAHIMPTQILYTL
jgi:hypothetical protein